MNKSLRLNEFKVVMLRCFVVVVVPMLVPCADWNCLCTHYLCVIDRETKMH